MTLPGQKPKLRFRKSSDVIWESNRSAGWIGTQRETISAQRVAIQIESVPIRNSYHHSGSGSSPGLTPDAQRPMVLRKESGSRALPPAHKDFRFGGMPCH